MGIHVCTFCHPGDRDKNWYPNTSSGDPILTFDSGRSWIMPDMILHYVWDHRFLPPADFVSDVMNHELVLEQSQRLQTKGASMVPTQVGYLTTSDFPTGQISKFFVARLEFLINGADRHGSRIQTRSVEAPDFRGQTK